MEIIYIWFAHGQFQGRMPHMPFFVLIQDAIKDVNKLSNMNNQTQATWRPMSMLWK